MRGCIIIYHYLLRTANYLISFPLKQFAGASSVDTSTGAKEKECVSAGDGEGAGKLTQPHDVASLNLHHKRVFTQHFICHSQGTWQTDYWHLIWNNLFKCNENVLPADEYAHVVVHRCDVVWDCTQTYRAGEVEQPAIKLCFYCSEALHESISLVIPKKVKYLGVCGGRNVDLPSKPVTVLSCWT